MSYSFSVSGASKDEAKTKASAEFDQVVANQPIHKADRAPAETALASIFDLIPDPEDGQNIAVSVNGSVSWTGDMEDGNVTSVSFGVSAGVYGTPTAAKVDDPEPATGDLADPKQPEPEPEAA